MSLLLNPFSNVGKRLEGNKYIKSSKNQAKWFISFHLATAIWGLILPCVFSAEPGPLWTTLNRLTPPKSHEVAFQNLPCCFFLCATHSGWHLRSALSLSVQLTSLWQHHHQSVFAGLLTIRLHGLSFGDQVYLKLEKSLCERSFVGVCVRDMNLGDDCVCNCVKREARADKNDKNQKPPSAGALFAVYWSHCPFLQSKRTVGVWVCNAIKWLFHLAWFHLVLLIWNEKSDKVEPSCVFTSKVMDDDIPTVSPLHLLTRASEGRGD